jgi:DNA polymerase-3 subunit chi
MTRIEFHFNTQERLVHTCRLLRKARSQGFRVGVVGEPSTLQRLNQALWSFSETEFLAHCTAEDPPLVQEASALSLGEQAMHRPDLTVLVNLGDQVPEAYERFERLIEVVANDEHGRSEARNRWKYYKAQGFDLVQHDLSKKSET